MSERPPVQVMAHPPFQPGRRYVPGASVDYNCHTCGRQLVVSPSSMRHVFAFPEVDFWHFCIDCAKELTRMMSELGEGTQTVRVHQVPGADREMRAAGLDDDADRDAAEVQRLRRLFGK